jgi:hypothetical protein
MAGKLISLANNKRAALFAGQPFLLNRYLLIAIYGVLITGK